MPAGWKTIKIFISSTFRDMQQERDHLVRTVFPELKEKCRKKRVQLIDVDLRWGVSEEDAESGRSLDICLDVIDSCRPYFLGILGHRYGFVPEGQRYSITAREIYHGVLHGGVPKQVVNLSRILEDRLEGITLTDKQKDCLVRCYRWDADNLKHILIEKVTPEDVNIIHSIFESYSIYQKNRSFFFFRSETLTSRLAGTETADFFEQSREDQDKLESLKREIVEARLPYFEYEDIETFGQLVLDLLWNRIEAEAEEAPDERDWLEVEDELHEQFMVERTRRFVGRRELLERMHGFCERDKGPSLLVVTGEPGCGKSALMARFTEEALRRYPDRFILSHFIGASPSSTSLRQMMRRLSTHLSRTGGNTETAPEDIKELLRLFPELLKTESEKHPVLIIIDAVNQLEKSDHAHSMYWLPQELPPNVCVVISTLAGEVHDAMLARRSHPQEEIVIGLTASEIRELVEAYLHEIRHEFPNHEVESDFYIKVEQGNPIYILIALEELRVFGKFKELGSRINRLPNNVTDLFDQVLERIESEFDPMLVRDCMSYLACARHGMTAQELQTLLKAYAPRIEPGTEAHKLPDMLWNRLRRSLGAYLFERSGVLDFFHDQLRIAVGKRYLNEESNRNANHQKIAGYFEMRWIEPYTRALDELPYQFIKAKNGQALVGILCNLKFIELKCNAGMTYDLDADYASALKLGGVLGEIMLNLEEFANFVLAQSHVLARNASLTFQQAANEPDSTAPARAARARINEGCEIRPWFQYVNKTQGRPPCMMTLLGHGNRVNACDFSPDGTCIVSASGRVNGPNIYNLKLWDVRNGAVLATLEGHTDPVMVCRFSPDGCRIISGSQCGTLKLWDVKTGTEIATLIGHKRKVNACAFSPDGNRVISASDDKTLNLWDAQTGSKLAMLTGHKGEVNACSFSLDGNRILSASCDETLKLWDANTGVELITLSGHTNFVNSCAFSSDGKHIISCSGDKTLKLWDARAGTELATLKGHDKGVAACSFSNDGSRIVSVSADLTVKLWDTETGVNMATLVGNKEKILSCAFSPDHHWVALTSADFHDYSLKLWNFQTRAEPIILEGHTDSVMACAFSPDGRRIVTASCDETLKVWNVMTKVEQTEPRGHTGTVTSCAFSPDGRRIVSASFHHTLKLWDTQAGVELVTLKDHANAREPDPFISKGSRNISAGGFTVELLKNPRTIDRQAALMAHEGSVKACAFSPDGRCVVSASADNTLRLWDAKTGSKLAMLTGHKGEVNACSFSPDGNRILSASDDKTLRLWNAKTGSKIAVLKGHEARVRACSFSPDGSHIVSASSDRTLRLWDTQKAEELAVLKGHTDFVNSCSFSPDGKCIVSASSDHTLRLWDAKTGAELSTLKGGVDSCTFSPDGRLIVSSCMVWDAQTGVEIAAHKDSFVWEPCFALTPDGIHVVSSGRQEGILDIWEIVSGNQVCEFQLDARIYSVASRANSAYFVAGDESGRVYILRIQNVTINPTVVTAWEYNRRRGLPWLKADVDYHFGCSHCRSWSEVPASALGSVIQCPRCRGIIKLNPFTINADWRPIAKAWHGKDNL